MDQVRPAPGFTLAGLLVVIAVASVLIGLLVATMQGTPEVAPRQAAVQSQAKAPVVGAAPCLPANCHSPDAGVADASPFFPVIPDRYDPRTVLDAALRGAFDPANPANQHAPGLLPDGAARSGDPSEVWAGLDVDIGSGDRFDILDVDWAGSKVEVLARRRDWESWMLVGGVDSTGRTGGA